MGEWRCGCRGPCSQTVVVQEQTREDLSWTRVRARLKVLAAALRYLNFGGGKVVGWGKWAVFHPHHIRATSIQQSVLSLPFLHPYYSDLVLTASRALANMSETSYGIWKKDQQKKAALREKKRNKRFTDSVIALRKKLPVSTNKNGKPCSRTETNERAVEYINYLENELYKEISKRPPPPLKTSVTSSEQPRLPILFQVLHGVVSHSTLTTQPPPSHPSTSNFPSSLGLIVEEEEPKTESSRIDEFDLNLLS